MNTRRNTDAALLSAYLEGEVTDSERTSIDAWLKDSAEARRTLQQLSNVRELLAAPATELESLDLAARVRSAVRKPVVAGRAVQRAHSRRWAPLWLGGAAASLGLLSLFALNPFGQDAAEFRAKGNELRVSEGSRWAGIQIYRVRAGSAPERLGPNVGADDGFVFSYTNLGAHPFQYLMIFAVDANAEVRWFYPAYVAAGTNPESIAIERGGANVPLGELVRHDFADGELSLYALFTNAPANVLQIEDWVLKHGRPDKTSPVPGGVLQRVDTRVQR